MLKEKEKRTTLSWMSKAIILPNSKESEMMVLGCMLTSVNALNIAADALSPEDFYYSEHQLIYAALQRAYIADKPADVHLISEDLKKLEKLDAIGGVVYLTTLAQYVGTSAFIDEYVSLVKEKAILRRMINTAQVIEKRAYEEPGDVFVALDEAQAQFFQISQLHQKSPYFTVKDLLSGSQATSGMPYLKELQERQQEFQEKGPNDIKITGMPTHFIDLDRVLNGLAPSNLMILAARPAMGKCVTGDTLIVNPVTGARVPIKELVKDRAGKVLTLGKDWKLKKTAPAAFVADGVKPTFNVTTALGKEIEATAVHPLLTIRGWKRVEELQVGDRIATPRSLPYFGSKRWPAYQLKVLSYFIADGNLTNTCPRFTNSNLRIVEDFKHAISGFGPVKVSVDRREDRTPTYTLSLDFAPLSDLRNRFAQAIRNFSSESKRRLYTLAKRFQLNPSLVDQWAHATAMPSASLAIAIEEEFPELPSLAEAIRLNPVTEFLKKIGLFGKNAHEKELPDEIFELAREDVALLINRLFSCDGTAYVASCSGNPFRVIAYSSVSKRLIHQIQHLLLRFGILSKVRSKITHCNEQAFPSFELEIHGRDDLIAFCREIGIHGKEEAVENVLQQTLSTAIGWSKDTLPLEIWDLILAKKGKRSWPSLFKAKGLPVPSNLHARKRSIRRDTLRRIAHVLDDLELDQLATSDVYWDRITSIASTGQKEVFDLSIEETHNFIAGDIIVHNTALALNLAENICFRNQVPVGVFSLEMSAAQLLHRLICSQAQVESEKIQTGALNGKEYQRVVEAVHLMQKQVMIIDDQPGLKITDLRARARRMKEAHNIGFLVIDYLQLISGSGTLRAMENRQIEISEISRMLKNLARELNIPILCLAQLSRKVEERQGHRPMMSDLRESGSLEQDSDVVMFLLRREYYDPYDKPGQAELIIAKNRHGAIGNVLLTFRKELAQFANFSPPAAAQNAPKSNDEAFSAFTPES